MVSKFLTAIAATTLVAAPVAANAASNAQALSARTPLLKKLKKHRPHLHRADNTLSPVVTAVAVGGTVAGGTLIGMMLWQAWKKRRD